jgi:hypothetical protein
MRNADRLLRLTNFYIRGSKVGEKSALNHTCSSFSPYTTARSNALEDSVVLFRDEPEASDLQPKHSGSDTMTSVKAVARSTGDLRWLALNMMLLPSLLVAHLPQGITLFLSG